MLVVLLIRAALVVLVILLVAVAAGAARSRGRFTLHATRGVRSRLDGAAYRVHDDSGAAADVMAALNQRATDLMRHLRAKYVRGRGAAAAPARREAAARLLALYNPDNLAENSPRDPAGDTSYTVNKGAVLALCLRDKEGANGIHNLETLTFVTFHELTHIAIRDVDHPPRFWRAFKFVLAEAREAGILRGVDYSRAPTTYCGMTIDYSPLFDAGLTPI